VDPKNPGRALPIGLFEQAIREAKPLGLQRVKLTGGEPLMHPQFLRLLDVVRRERLGLILETNGVLCSPEVAAAIARVPDRAVSVSLDGARAETHEWVRGVPGCFEEACQGVRNLVAAGVSPQIIMTLVRKNASEVEEVAWLAEGLGASSVKYNILHPMARGERLYASDKALSIEELIVLGEYVETDFAPRTPLRLYYDYPMAFRPMSRIAGENGSGRCGILNILGILSSGEYALCGIGEHVPGLVFGRIQNDELAWVWWRAPGLLALREGLPGKLSGVCEQCVMRTACLGSCVAQSAYRSGDLWAPFWFCAEAFERGWFPETRLTPVGVAA
jgi:SynChlorMet cassette radical SAM/SPASM protein ScmF